MHIYKLTSTHTIYFNGKLEVLNTNDTFALAGLQLSSYGDKSPFHHKGDIIRLPNCILEYVGEFRNTPPPPPPIDRAGRVVILPTPDPTKYTQSTTANEKDYFTLILLGVIIFLLVVIIYKLETYFK